MTDAPALPTARPLFIGAERRYLFAWHHPARPDVRRGAAVVLCPPVGYDYMCVYRPWRILAERLAGLGFDAFRFDYEGTGNSSGGPEQPNLVTAWLESVGRAIDEARARTGSASVALVGLRVGAALALHAAGARGGVERLVLWSAYPSGRAAVREMKAFARFSQQDHVPEPETDEYFYAAGYLVTRATADALATLRPGDISRRPAPHVLLVDRDDLSVDSGLGDHLESLGAAVTRIRPPGTTDMLADPALAKFPAEPLDAIAGWLSAWRASGAPESPRDRSPSSAQPEPARGDGFSERAVRFGPDDRLFGIVTAPEAQVPAAPAIVLLNTGAEYHIGPHRLYVPLAREWAARGHLVLRYDLGGIGDSVEPPGAGQNVAYPAHALDDLRHAIGFVRQLAPDRKVIVSGLCSGGWLSFVAAREGLPIDAIASVNPPLYLRDGPAGARELAAASLTRRIQRALGKVIGGPMRSGLARDLERIAARGLACLFVFSRGDGGLDYFDLYGSQALRRRTVRDRIRLVVVDGAGHTFRPSEARRALHKRLVDFVAEFSGDRADPPR